MTMITNIKIHVCSDVIDHADFLFMYRAYFDYTLDGNQYKNILWYLGNRDGKMSYTHTNAWGIVEYPYSRCEQTEHHTLLSDEDRAVLFRMAHDYYVSTYGDRIIPLHDNLKLTER